MRALPIDSHLDHILALAAEAKNLVLVAEPGAGKTTRLPAALAKKYAKKILVLEPRRVAAVAAADRVAYENNWQLGREVGYRVRFENKTSPATRLIFMTEALLTRQLLIDDSLRDVDFIVLDEFHERSLHVDLALGLLRELQELQETQGASFKIIVMSATLDAEKIAAYLGDAPIVRVPGQTYPLKIEWLEKSLRPGLNADFYAAFTRKVKEAFASSERNVLAFLPGVGEITRAQERLESWSNEAPVEIVALHGSLSLEDQRRALQPTTTRRLILATNIAESSLTVDGVAAVVDSGLAKVMRRNFTTGFSRLELGRISAASARQRSGRAARQTAGVCYRLWSQGEDTALKKEEVPEVLRSDMTESLLYLAAMGVTDAENFSWFEKPAAAALKTAKQELQGLRAVDGSGQITEHGRQMVQLPLEPRLSHFLILCARHGQLQAGSRVAALLQEREILRDDAVDAYLGDGFENDLALRLHLLEQFEAQDSGGRLSAQLRRELHGRSTKQVLLAADRFTHLLKNILPQEKKSLDEIVLLTFGDRLCRRRGQSERALMAGGRGVRLATTSVVRVSEFFIALQAVDFSTSADTVVGLAVGVPLELILKTLPVVDSEQLFFDEEKGRLFMQKQRRVGDLPIEEARLSPASGAQSEEQLARFLSENIEYIKKHNEDFADWLERWRAFAEAEGRSGDELPMAEALAMAVVGESRLDSVTKKDLIYFIETQLAPDIVTRFRASAPATFTAPTGSKFKIRYPEGRQPYVEVRLQELFGVRTNPKILKETPLQFHLLGPNYRPQQVTSDIASFWANTYPEVRREPRRYPKHSWPEDPLTAPAVRKGQSHKR